MEIDAGIRTGQGPDFGSELEVTEIGAMDGAGVEEVGPLAMDEDLAINDLEGAFMFTGLPAIERFAVEQRKPIGGVFCPGTSDCWCAEQHGEDFAAREFGHQVLRAGYFAENQSSPRARFPKTAKKIQPVANGNGR